MELVYIEIKVLAFVFGYALPLKRGEIELRNKHRPQEVRLVLANPALSEVYEENPLVVHDELEVNRAFRLSYDIPKGRVREKLSDFVLNR